MTSKKARGGARFLLTRLSVVGITVAGFVWLWGGIVWANRPDAEDGAAAASDTEVVEEEDWVWDEARQEWVLESEYTPPAAAMEPAEDPAAEQPQPIIYIERQPVHYVERYIEEKPVYIYVTPDEGGAGNVPPPAVSSPEPAGTPVPSVSGSDGSPSAGNNPPVVTYATPAAPSKPSGGASAPQPTPAPSQPTPVAPQPTPVLPQPTPTSPPATPTPVATKPPKPTPTPAPTKTKGS